MPAWEHIALKDYLDAMPVHRRRLRFRATGNLLIPAFSGTLWHAVLGPALKSATCPKAPAVCDLCAGLEQCAYARLLESRPQPGARAPLGSLARIPGPLVLDTSPWRTRWVRRGDDVELGVVVVDATGDLLRSVTGALALGAAGGLGRDRVSLKLEGWMDEPWPPATRGGHPDMASWRLRMRTPLRLKRNGTFLDHFHPVALTRDLGRRIAALGHYHGALPWPAPWTEVAADLEALQVVGQRLEWVEARRYSGRQARTVPLGGVIGDVELRRVGPALARLLTAATVLHAGKGTSLGLGELALETAARSDASGEEDMQ